MGMNGSAGRSCGNFNVSTGFMEYVAAYEGYIRESGGGIKKKKR